MAQKDNILHELKGLGSSLANDYPSVTYTVPAEYFEALPQQILTRIRALETGLELTELAISSPLHTANPVTPYQVPAGYFAGLEERVMAAVLHSSINLPAAEELETLSPLLSGMKKEMPYSVPGHYFERLTPTTITTVPQAKVISIVNRNWFRYAAAAIITGFVALGGILFLGRNDRIDPTAKSHEWVEKNMKKVSTDELDNFINLTEQGTSTAIASTSHTDEVKELMKNVSDKDIQDFLNDAQVAEPDGNDDLLLN